MNQRRAYLGVALFTLVATCSSVAAADSTSESRLTSATSKLHAGQYDECLAILRDINDEQLPDDVLRAKYRKCLREAEDGLDQQNQARRDFDLAEKAAQRGDRRSADRYYRLVASNSLGDAGLRRTAAARLMNNNGDAQPKVVLASAESVSMSFAPPKGDEEKSGDEESAEDPPAGDETKKDEPPADEDKNAATKPESKESDEQEAPASDDAAKKDEPAKDDATNEPPAESESPEAAPAKPDPSAPAKPAASEGDPRWIEQIPPTSIPPTVTTPQSSSPPPPPPSATNQPVSSSPPGSTGGASEIVPVEQLVPGTMPPSSPPPAPVAPATPARSEPTNWPSGGTSIYSNPPPKSSTPTTMMPSSGGGEIVEVQPVTGDVGYTSGSGTSSSGMMSSSSAGPVYSSPGSSAVSQGMGASNLVDSVVQEQELLWQQAVKTFTDTEDKIRAAITAENFNEANTLMDYARQTIESNRRNAYPASRYDEYKQKADDLSRYIADEEKKYAARQVEAKTTEVRENEAKRAALQDENKRRLIEQLMSQAEELSKERRYDEAIGVLKQVQAVDPSNEQATFMREVLEGTRVQTATFDAIETRKHQTQEVLLENEEDMIPWHHDLQYPRNWPEITARRKEQTDTGDSDKVSKEATRKARRKLKKLAPEVRFESQQLDQVVKYLRDATGLNIIVQWTALEQAGIEREKEINLELVDVSYEKVLDSILESLGAETGSQLAYEIDDGVLTISTKEAFSLNPPPPPVVYDVTDLTFRLVDYQAVIAQQLIQLIQTGGSGLGQGGGQGGGGGGLGGGGGGLGGGGGGGGLGGGGGGLGGGGGGGGLGGGGQGGGQNTGLGGNETQLRRERIDELKQLIQDTIDPESWRDAGGNIGSIASLETQIVVTQTVNAHKQIQDLLRELRRERSIQIAIEARFVTITRNFLEQIGVDLDVILNSGNAGYDQASNGSGVLRDPVTGSVLLIPRQFSRLGFTPGAPAGIGVPLITGFLNQPYRQPGLVPGVGDVAPHSGQMSPIPIINNTLDLSTPAQTPIAGSLGGASTVPAFTLFGSFLDNIQVDFLLRASQLDNRASDLDAPRVVISNGQRASFESFLNQQFVSGAIPVIGDNVGLFQPVVNTAPTGRSLDVQGFVSADRRYVSLNLRLLQVISSIRETFAFQGPGLLNGGGAIQLIDFRPNIVQTTVTVPDGGTLLIGGLKLAAERERDAGVPVLSRVPVLKRAFSNTSTVKDDQILLILVRPKIIIQDEAEQEAFPTLTQNE